MRIIKAGTVLDDNRTYEGLCNHCGCVFRCQGYERDYRLKAAVFRGWWSWLVGPTIIPDYDYERYVSCPQCRYPVVGLVLLKD